MTDLLERLKAYEPINDAETVESKMKSLGIVDGTEEANLELTGYAAGCAVGMLDSHVEHYGARALDPQALMLLVASVYLTGVVIGVDISR